MSWYNQNQVRNFYVVDSTHGVTFPSTINSKHVYGKYAGPKGTITTDKINRDLIDSITISKPTGYMQRTWTISVPTPVSDKDYILYFHFNNWTGFGMDDKYEKFAVAHVTSAMTNVSELAKALAKNINKQFSVEVYNPFANVTVIDNATGASAFAVNTAYSAGDIIVDGTNYYKVVNAIANSNTNGIATLVSNGDIVKIDGAQIVLVEEVPTEITAMELERQMMPQNYGLVIDSYTQDNTFVNGVWAKFAEYSNDNLNITMTSTEVIKNTFVIYDMESFFSKTRADLYGYNGWPNVNPSQMVAPQIANATSTEFYILDIKYKYQGTGMFNQYSEKEISFACSTLSTLVTIANNFRGTNKSVQASDIPSNGKGYDITK